MTARRAQRVARGWLAALALSAAPIVPAADVRVLALFPDKAMLEVDGQRRVWAAGDRLAPGIRLISADPNGAVVEIDGRRERLGLGSAVSATYEKPRRREVRIVKDRTGSYRVDGLINGQPVRFLVDTGATSVAMSERDARRLGIAHRVDGQRVAVRTAGGSVAGHAVVLRSLSVGGLELEGVRAIVLDGDSPPQVLLGMSALGAFEMDQRDNLLVLRTRY